MDREAFEQMAGRLRPLMLKVGRAYFGSVEDAEDVAQEALVQLWRYCEQLDESRNVEALAVRVAKHCCVNWTRRTHLQVVRGGEALEAVSGSLHPSPHEEMERRESAGALDEAIRQLQPRERQLFEMRQQEGLSTEEIAQRTGIPKASVQSIISMARRKLLNEMKRRTEL